MERWKEVMTTVVTMTTMIDRTKFPNRAVPDGDLARDGKLSSSSRITHLPARLLDIWVWGFIFGADHRSA